MQSLNPRQACHDRGHARRRNRRGHLWVAAVACLIASFVVSCGEGGSSSSDSGGGITVPVGILFQANWDAALGSSDFAISDGGLWNILYCMQIGQTLNVVSGAPLGWTLSPNVLRLQQLGESVCGTVERDGNIPPSTTHWGRVYFRDDEPSTRHFHPLSYPALGDLQIAAWSRAGLANGSLISLRTYYDENLNQSPFTTLDWTIGRAPTPTQPGSFAILPRGTWYRYEWQIEYLTPNTYRIYPRIYDMAGNLLFDSNTYFSNEYPLPGTFSLQEYYDMGNVFGISNPGLAENISIGNEGPATSTNTGGFWYHARFALSLDDWIGP